MNVFRRRYRVFIDVDVAIHPIDPVRAARSRQEQMIPESAFTRPRVAQAENVARQQRLLDALVRDEKILDGWLRNEVGRVVTEEDAEEFERCGLSEEMFETAVDLLPAHRRAYFDDMLAKGEFSAAVNALYYAGRAEVLSLDIQLLRAANVRTSRNRVDHRYRASMNVDAGFDQIDRALARKVYRQLCARGSIDRRMSLDEFIDHQVGLAAAMVQHEGALDRWLRELVIFDVANGGAEPFRRRVYEEWLLYPIIERLPEKDQRYFEELGRGELLESLRAFEEAMTSRIVFLAIDSSPGVPVT